MVSPLDRLLTSKDNMTSMLPWDDTAEDAFMKIKGTFSNAAFLAHLDPTPPLALMSEACRTAIGAVLQQWMPTSSLFP
ncbi:hypothetical protein MRX96_009578 [Rhipicephalus microplus]